jgi:YidC/Oxa1 family membrane protein insertase
MDFDKKTIFAFLMIGLVFLFVNTPLYQKLFFPEAYEQQLRQQQYQQQHPSDDKAVPSQPESRTDVNAVPSETSTVQPEETGYPAPEPDDVRSGLSVPPLRGTEKVITVENDLYRAVLSSQGADVIGFTLKEYEGAFQTFVQLIPEDARGALSVGFVDNKRDTVSTRDWFFDTSANDGDVLVSRSSTVTLSFRSTLSTGGQLVKTYTFYPDRYDFDLSVEFIRMGPVISERVYFIEAYDGLNSTEKDIKDDMYYTKAALSASGDVNKGYKPQDEWYEETGDIDWLAIRTKYFALAVLPQNRKGVGAHIHAEEVSIPNQSEKWKKYQIRLVMPFVRDMRETGTFKIYLGPLDNDILKQYEANLEDMMDFGFKLIQPFSKGILWLFKELHKVIPNYGVVLIVFAFLIKIVVYPLTHKSYSSMKKMQALQPQLAELKEKYAKDPQRLNQETMKLYKESGVNPLGGCLPMLLQLPLLWALFINFRTTIELRGEGFAFWINDLSSPDTVATLPFSLPFYGDSVNILPFIMAGTMVLQQKLTTTDPKQKMMMYFMPVFLFFLFNNFPSGLNLYYALFNILSIVQQKWFVGDVKVEARPATGTKRKKKR